MLTYRKDNTKDGSCVRMNEIALDTSRVVVGSKMLVVSYANAMMRQQETCIPGGDMVLSKTEGIVISITGLLDETPPAASLYASSISSMLKNEQKFHISKQKLWNNPVGVTQFFFLLSN